MRVLLRTLPIGLLWVLAACPLGLWLLQRWSPVQAARTVTAVGIGLHDLALYGGGAALLAALLFPPLPAGVRLLLSRLLQRLRADRGPLMRAEVELRHFETAARQLEAGRAALNVGDYAIAAAHLRRALELEPDGITARLQLGLALLQLDDQAGAEAEFAVVAAREPDHAFGDALLWLGRCRMRRRDFAGAADLLQQHADRYGGNRRSHYWLGRCRRALGDRAGARAALRVAADPNNRFPRTPVENWFRACARTALWTLPGGRA